MFLMICLTAARWVSKALAVRVLGDIITDIKIFSVVWYLALGGALILQYGIQGLVRAEADNDNE